MAFELSKTLFIGLGGTGAHTLIRTKSLLKETFGEVPPMIKFLILDTDTREKVSYFNGSEKTEFDMSEFFQITINSVKQYCEANPKATKFFDKQIYKVKSSITEGAGQIRSCGRLAFIKEFDSLSNNILPRALASVRNWQAAQNSKYSFNLQQPIRVYVVFSIAGGTGAGSFIDLPLILRNHMVPGEKINGIGLLPDIYSLKGLPCKYSDLNALTGMTEYEFIADGILADVCNPEDPAMKISTPLTNIYYKVDNQAFYDNFVLVNNRSSNNIQYTEVPEICDFLSRSTYLFTAALGGNAASTLDNVSAIGAAEPHKGKWCRYLGLGTAEMIFDGNLVAEYYALNYLDKLIDSIDDSPADKIDYQEFAQATIYDWQLQEDRNENQVIHYLLEGYKSGLFTYNYQDRTGNAGSIKAQHDKFIETESGNLDKHISGKRADLSSAKTKNIDDTLFNGKNAYLNQPGGLFKVKKLLDILIGRFNAMKEELGNENSSYKEKLGSMSTAFKDVIDDIKYIEEKNYLFPGKKEKKLDSACQGYIDMTNSECLYLTEIERRDSAMILYDYLTGYLKQVSNKVKTFEENLAKVKVIIAENIQRINSAKVIHPFVIEVHNLFLDTVRVNDSDVTPTVNFGGVTLSDFILKDNLNQYQIFENLMQFGKGLDKTNELRTLGILDVVGRMDHKLQKRLLKDLKSASGVLRLTDATEAFPTAIMYDIGVPDLQHSALMPKQADDKQATPPSFGDLLKSEFQYRGGAPNLINLQDPKRIIISAYESGSPAFAILNFERYQRKFESHKGVTLYSNLYWQEQIERLRYTIFPINTDSAIKAWTLAIIVTKVEHDLRGDSAKVFFRKTKASNYFVRSGSRADAINNYLFDLSSSYRPKAYSIFEQSGIADELLPEIIEIIKLNLSTYNEIISKLKENATMFIHDYAQHMLDDSTLVGPAHENTRHQLTKEHNFIKEFKSYDLI